MSDFLKLVAVIVVASILSTVSSAILLAKLTQGGMGAVNTDIASTFTQLRVTDEARFDGTVTVTSGGLSLTGGTLSSSVTTTLARLIPSGVVSSTTGVATSTLTASQICMNSLLKITPVSTTPTLTLPSTSTLFVAASGGCLTSNGQYIDLHYQALTTSTILAAGTGGTLLTNASATVGANKGAWIRFIRDSATTYLAFMISED